MAKLKIDESSIRQFSSALVSFIEDKLTGPAARGKLSRSLKPFMEDKISEAIAGKGETGSTVTCKAFRPDVAGGLDLVGQLGIGDGDGTLPEKYTKGWQALLPGAGDDSAATVTTTFSKRSFGKVTYSLNKEAFYAAPVNNFVSHSDGKSNTVPWMRHFIEGQVVQDHEYKEGDFPQSRTKLGIMVREQGSLWKIEPQPDPFGRITTAIKTAFSRKTFAQEVKDMILRAIQ